MGVTLCLSLFFNGFQSLLVLDEFFFHEQIVLDSFELQKSKFTSSVRFD